LSNSSSPFLCWAFFQTGSCILFAQTGLKPWFVVFASRVARVTGSQSLFIVSSAYFSVTCQKYFPRVREWTNGLFALLFAGCDFTVQK
jgi:hypothetical protein